MKLIIIMIMISILHHLINIIFEYDNWKFECFNLKEERNEYANIIKEFDEKFNNEKYEIDKLHNDLKIFKQYNDINNHIIQQLKHQNAWNISLKNKYIKRKL